SRNHDAKELEHGTLSSRDGQTIQSARAGRNGVTAHWSGVRNSNTFRAPQVSQMRQRSIVFPSCALASSTRSIPSSRSGQRTIAEGSVARILPASIHSLVVGFIGKVLTQRSAHTKPEGQKWRSEAHAVPGHTAAHDAHAA